MNTFADLRMYRYRVLCCIPGVILLNVLVVFTLGCGKPEIRAFDVTPSRICMGENTVVSWEIKGDAGGILSAMLTNDTNTSVLSMPVPAKGSGSLAFQEDTRLTITAASDERVFAEYDVLVFPGQGKKEFGQLAELAPNEPGILVARINLSNEKWPDNLRVGAVASLIQSELMVSHEDHQVTLPTQESPSEAFRGTKVSGSWTLKTKLLPSETGENPSEPPPTVLGISIEFYCESGD